MERQTIRTEYLDPARSSVLHVSGEVNWTTSYNLASEIKTTLEANHPARLIVDLNGVNRIDSSGISALVEGLRRADSKHAQFTLCGLSPFLRSVMQRTCLDQVFDIRLTIQEALQYPKPQ